MNIMKHWIPVYTTKIAGLSMLATLWLYTAAGGSLAKVETYDVSGVTEFEAPTNMPAVSVKGKSNSLQGSVMVSRNADGILLEHLEVWAPVKTLATGMGVRDEHMRKQVFTTAEGQTPDLRFGADKAVCSMRSGQEFTCAVTGNLSIRGLARPFSMSLKVKQAGQSAFKAVGDAVVKLSDYEITQPTQFGVKLSNEVKLRFELASKQRAFENASDGGRH
jgi:polyisoprenoid-binding protein YceI